MMRTMQAVQVATAGGPLELVEREVPQPPSGHVLIKVQACGICHSDSLTKDGLWPSLQYPRVPGHAVAGVLEKLCPATKERKVGQRTEERRGGTRRGRTVR